jgi:hypothetical protein
LAGTDQFVAMTRFIAAAMEFKGYGGEMFSAQVSGSRKAMRFRVSFPRCRA